MSVPFRFSWPWPASARPPRLNPSRPTASLATVSLIPLPPAGPAILAQAASAAPTTARTALWVAAPVSRCMCAVVCVFHAEQGAYCTSGCLFWCPAGTWSLSLSGVSVSTCLYCGPGYWSVAGQVSCSPCPPGRWGNQTGATSMSSCSLCPAGKFQPLNGQSSPSACEDCPITTFGPFQGAASQASCLPCSAGTYGTTPALTVCAQARICVALFPHLLCAVSGGKI